MKLWEMFNSADKKKAMAAMDDEREFYKKSADRETSKGDWIVTQYELGKLTIDEAWKMLKDAGLDAYGYELGAAEETRAYRLKKNH